MVCEIEYLSVVVALFGDSNIQTANDEFKQCIKKKNPPNRRIGAKIGINAKHRNNRSAASTATTATVCPLFSALHNYFYIVQILKHTPTNQFTTHGNWNFRIFKYTIYVLKRALLRTRSGNNECTLPIWRLALN